MANNVRVVREYTKFLLYWIPSALILLPTTIVLILPLIIWKFLVVCFVYFFKRELGKTLNAADSSFTQDEFLEANSYCGNILYFIIDGTPNIEKIRQGFRKNVLSAKCKTGNKLQFQKLCQVPVNFCGIFFWKTIPMDLSKQIYEDKTGFTQNTQHESQLHEKLANLMTSSFQKACPLWEIVIFTGFKFNQSVLAFKMHHVLGDGYSQIHLVDRMIQKSSLYLVKGTHTPFKQKINLFLSAPFRIIDMYKKLVFFDQSDIFRKKKTSKTGVLSTTWIPLEQMKNIRRATSTHFATIGMSILGGAIRRYLLETKKPSDLPEFITFGHSLPKPGHPISTMVNHWGFCPINIPMQTENAYERLRKSEEIFQGVLDDGVDTLSDLIITAHGLFIPAVINRFLLNENYGLALGFTNLPGNKGEASLFGEYDIKNMAFVTGLQCPQVAVVAAMYSHNATVAFSVFVNEDIIPDQDGIDKVVKHYLRLELEELVHSCEQKDTVEIEAQT